MIKEDQTSSILKTSLPAALDLASQPVMWLIEAVLIGRLSAAALGGVGFALQIILLTVTVLLTFVMGATVLINQYLGNNDRWNANHILGQTVMWGILISIPIALLYYFASPYIFLIISEREITGQLSTTGKSGIDAGISYLKTVAYFIPVIVVNFISLGMVRGAGDTKTSMIVNVTTNLIHLSLAPLLIYGLLHFPRLEVRGAALAMGLAHTTGFCLTMIYLRRKTSVLFLSMRELTTPNSESIRKLFQMGLPTTVEQLVYSGGQVIVTGFVAVIGISALAIHMILLRIQGVLSMIFMGFALASMTHIGKNVGANNHHIAERTGITSQRIVLVVVFVISLSMIVFSDSVIHLFLRKEDTVLMDFGFKAVFILFAALQIPKAMNTVIIGNLRGAGDIKWLMWINVVTVLLFEIGINWIGAFIFHFGLMGIWAVHGIDEIVKSSINYDRFRGGKWKRIQLLAGCSPKKEGQTE